jgi:hypothetical protein
MGDDPQYCVDEIHRLTQLLAAVMQRTESNMIKKGAVSCLKELQSLSENLFRDPNSARDLLDDEFPSLERIVGNMCKKEGINIDDEKYQCGYREDESGVSNLISSLKDDNFTNGLIIEQIINFVRGLESQYRFQQALYNEKQDISKDLNCSTDQLTYGSSSLTLWSQLMEQEPIKRALSPGKERQFVVFGSSQGLLVMYTHILCIHNGLHTASVKPPGSPLDTFNTSKVTGLPTNRVINATSTPIPASSSSSSSSSSPSSSKSMALNCRSSNRVVRCVGYEVMPSLWAVSQFLRDKHFPVPVPVPAPITTSTADIDMNSDSKSDNSSFKQNTSKSKSSNYIDFHLKDMLEADVSNSDVLVLTSLCWDRETRQRVAKKLTNEMKSGSVVVDYRADTFSEFGLDSSSYVYDYGGGVELKDKDEDESNSEPDSESSDLLDEEMQAQKEGNNVDDSAIGSLESDLNAAQNYLDSLSIDEDMEALNNALLIYASEHVQNDKKNSPFHKFIISTGNNAKRKGSVKFYNVEANGDDDMKIKYSKLQLLQMKPNLIPKQEKAKKKKLELMSFKPKLKSESLFSLKPIRSNTLKKSKTKANVNVKKSKESQPTSLFELHSIIEGNCSWNNKQLLYLHLKE